MRRSVRAAIVTAGIVSVLGPAGTAFADGLTVTMPCGCQPVVDQPVGNAPDTPAAGNPTGTVGNLGSSGFHVYPSAVVTFD